MIKNTNFNQTYNETESLCKTETDGNNGKETTLADWMREGNWQEMTPAEMAQEWDELSEDNE